MASKSPALWVYVKSFPSFRTSTGVASASPIAHGDDPGQHMAPLSELMSAAASTCVRSSGATVPREQRPNFCPLPDSRSLLGSQYRCQLRQRFLDIHFGASSHGRRIFAYEKLEIDGSKSTGSAITAAFDALCFAQLGTTFDDEALKSHAKFLYDTTVQFLNLQLRMMRQIQPTVAQMDDVVGAIHAIMPCAWFTSVDIADNEWTVHASATFRILQVFGWQSVSSATRRMLASNWKFRAFYDAIRQRTEVSFNTESVDGICLPDETSAGLLPCALEVPALILRTDKLCQASGSGSVGESDVLRQLTRLSVAVAKLKRWHLDWVKSFPEISSYRMVPITHFTSFRSLAGENTYVFPVVYDFSASEDERGLRMLLVCLLHLDEAMDELYTTYSGYCTGPELVVQLRGAGYDARSSADELCTLIPWFTQPRNGAFASTHAWQPLVYAAQYYKKHGLRLQLQWCRKVARSLIDKYGIAVDYGKTELLQVQQPTQPRLERSCFAHDMEKREAFV